MKIKLLPLDERPCNIDFAEKICDYNNLVDLVVPDKNILGNKKHPAKYENILEFIKKDYEELDYLVISMDMFLYGGLIPSRIHEISSDEIISKLDEIKKLKAMYPEIKIFAFSTIMRTPAYDSSDEEPNYYEEYGYKIFRKKYLEDKNSIIGILNESEEKEFNEIEIPINILNDYESRRKKNLQINLNIIEMLGEGIFDYIIFPQDDSSEFGYTRMDQKIIYNRLMIEQSDKYSVHPGADEVALTLIARIYNSKKTKKIYIEFKNNWYKNGIPKYEDRVIEETLSLHIEASGLIRSDCIKQADNILYYNLPDGDVMIEAFDQKLELNRNFDEEILKTEEIFILDNCYSNGGDLSLIKELSKNNFFDKIGGYSAWNTNSNSLGTILCMISLSDNCDEVKKRKFIFERVIEDCFYQSIVRKKTNLEFLPLKNLNYFNLGNKQNDVIDYEIEQLNEYIKLYIKREIEFSIEHPWNRMFEININIKEIK